MYRSTTNRSGLSFVGTFTTTVARGSTIQQKQGDSYVWPGKRYRRSFYVISKPPYPEHCCPFVPGECAGRTSVGQVDQMSYVSSVQASNRATIGSACCRWARLGSSAGCLVITKKDCSRDYLWASSNVIVSIKSFW